MAARAGKDVFCEKPLTLTVEEGRILSDTVNKHQAISMTGTENRSRADWLLCCEAVRNGAIGKLRTMRVALPRGHRYCGVHPNGYPIEDRPLPLEFKPEPAPDWLDYEMWLGPTPEAFYTPDRCHWNFRWILNYSGGHLTDWGGHLIDLAQAANGTEESGPVSVEGRGVFLEHGLYDTATDWEITYDYANGVTLICTSGTPGFRFEGSDGWVAFDFPEKGLRASSEDILQYKVGSGTTKIRTNSAGERRDFLDCVKTRKPTYAPFEIGHRSATVCHIGNIAMKLDRKLRWDPDRERFENDESANWMLSRPMRAPWRQCLYCS
jgi:predicted dehydrogenase